ncbi:hypothetical protein SAMD00019534_102400 [Acytostelium subglobosum LB1]|uniref:hypothetical protein n=1 Tax=Acytostelium subglobosum LB1 TaxID=1410327 RepID=UPI000644E9D3|nr:hypothetical protein SAMD00019534_102400 [Acytostelium subglobosum LB1]GAM27065.1 hypothetical protein SAMD00019534_102400 [Acytostelium subglobosum LB1]|eukprot:XP_012749945.1 hypothetical protein SAMD00019534_102400 [Acytostelium subglobosum LB1]
MLTRKSSTIQDVTASLKAPIKKRKADKLVIQTKDEPVVDPLQQKSPNELVIEFVYPTLCFRDLLLVDCGEQLLVILGSPFKSFSSKVVADSSISFTVYIGNPLLTLSDSMKKIVGRHKEWLTKKEVEYQVVINFAFTFKDKVMNPYDTAVNCRAFTIVKASDGQRIDW